MKKKNIFVFDFDGTIADSNELEKATMVEAIHRYHDENFRPDDIFLFFGPTEEGILRKIVREDRREEAVSFFYDYYEKRQDDLLRPFEGMEDILRLLKEKEKRIFLLTGRSAKTLNMSLERLGFAPYFEACYTGSDEGINKPLNMERLIRENGLRNEDVVYVGDSLDDTRSMKTAKVDLLSAGYSHSLDYQEELRKNNPGNVVSSVLELRTRIEEIL